ncbi:vWA domain-containing protein [Hydrocarboniphaga sp.]|uniref:vWA domain-containing protein n=1 Tax=Hydrocarboniphaga sp. TaxID=2033016 RepID=UPI003D142AE1
MSIGTLLDSIGEALQAFHFIRPLWLLAAPPLWWLSMLLARRRAAQGNWATLIDAPLLSALRLDAGQARKPWSPWLALAWTVAVIALAGPSWRQDATQAHRAGAAWIIVLDLSPSMASADVTPTRITRARYAIEDLLLAARDAKVGLVVFSDEPYVVAPLTDDANTLRSLLQPLTPELMPTAGDQLAPALDSAAQLLQRSGASDQRMILLSDGISDPASALAAAQKLRSQGAQLDVIGVGTRGGAPLVGPGGAFEHDAQGAALLSRVDTEHLSRLANTGGGRYVDLDALPQLLTALQDAPTSPGAAVETQGVQVQRWQDSGFWLLPLLLLLAASFARRGWI